MKDTGNAGRWNWRRNLTDVVDVLVGACAFFAAYATIDGAADSLDLLIVGVIVLAGLGLMLEPSVVGRPTDSVVESGGGDRSLAPG